MTFSIGRGDNRKTVRPFVAWAALLLAALGLRSLQVDFGLLVPLAKFSALTLGVISFATLHGQVPDYEQPKLSAEERWNRKGD